MTDFELFQYEFKKWQERFGLTGWKVYFKQDDDDRYFASITPDLSNMIATVYFNNNLPDKDKEFKNAEILAKHEALHLLLTRLELNGRARFINSDEIYESCEELVHKLEDIIK